MNMVRRVFCVMVILSFVGAVACGDDDVTDGDGDNQGGEITDNDNDGNGQANDDDCPEGKTYNPIAGECVEDTSNDNDSNDGTNDGNNDGNNDGTNDGNNDGNNDGTNDGNNDGTNDGTGCGPGALVGQSCGADGAILANATVRVVGEDCEGEPFEKETTADGQGVYEIDNIPAGEHTLIIESGSFTGQDPVMIYEDATTDLMAEAKKTCVSDEGVDIAVADGSFDDVGEILDGMGIDYEPYSSDSEVEALLSNASAMNQYDIIFVECSWWTFEGFDGFSNQIQNAVAEFVAAGNSLYASDQSQSIIQQPLPQAVDFYQESQGVEGPRQGDGVSSLIASVESTSMQNVLNSTTVDLDYSSSPSWAVAEGASNSNSTVHFRADAPLTGLSGGTMVYNSPLMVHYDDPGGGAAVYTSFHNSGQATGDMEDILEFAIYQL